jgi:6,7-dimethyl-8-ribityllumazine synthase
MNKKKQNLSEFKVFSHSLSSKTRIGIIVSEWNPEITGALCDGAVKTLIEQGFKKSSIIVHKVPGSFELPLGAQYLIENTEVDAVICLGCVIQGETRHFEFICQTVSQQIGRLNIDYNLPVIFGLLTTDNFEQAKARSGGKHGNKGVEAAIAAIKMLQLRDSVFPKKES